MKQVLWNILTIVTVIVVALLVMHLGNLEKNMPKRICHVEETVRKIELKPINCSFLDDCITDYFINFEDDVKCESGIRNYAYIMGMIGTVSNSRIFANFDNETRICLVTERKEICEIK